MDGQYWKGDQTMSNEWLLTSDFWQFLEPWHGRWYEYEIFIASCTDNIHDLENDRLLLGDMIEHVGIYGSRVAEGLSAFNVGLVVHTLLTVEKFFNSCEINKLWVLMIILWKLGMNSSTSVTNGFPSQRDSTPLLWFFICSQYEQVDGQISAGELRCHESHMAPM